MADREIKEAKSLRWLALQFPKVKNPKDNGDRLCNCINLYCTNGAELIERQAAKIEKLSKGEFAYKEIPVSYEKIYRIGAENAVVETIKVEAYKECISKANEIITEIYNKHIFGYNDLEAEEKDAIINFSDDITHKLDNLLKEMVGENNA